MRPQCIKDRCYSPVACGGFGYCRELNNREEIDGLYSVIGSKLLSLGVNVNEQQTIDLTYAIMKHLRENEPATPNRSLT